MDPADAAIGLREVTKVFPGAASPAVDRLTLDVPRGSIVAFVGPSGCGKTTTLKMINRLIEPTSGSIDVLGAPSTTLPVHELRRKIGYVIQQVGLFPHRTIAGNIGTVPKLLGWDKRRIADRVGDLVDLVGLDPSLLTRYPRELSGGQQQRVGVARALAADPPILLMDEPYSAVDPIVRARLQNELLMLQEKVHKTVVIVTHDIEEALHLGDKVALFNVGGILEQYDTPEEVLRAPASPFVESFLGRERGLRRLGLRTVADVGIAPGPTVQPGATIAEARAVAAAHGTDWVAVLDGERLLGWTDVDGAAGAAALVSDRPLERFVSWVSAATSLREALDSIVMSRTRVAVVLDEERYVGMLWLHTISEGLT